jgi:hypothetical protein
MPKRELKMNVEMWYKRLPKKRFKNCDAEEDSRML